MQQDVGRASTYRVGAALRKLYVDRLGFVPPTIDRDGIVQLRSTPIARTMETLQQVRWETLDCN